MSGITEKRRKANALRKKENSKFKTLLGMIKKNKLPMYNMANNRVHLGFDPYNAPMLKYAHITINVGDLSPTRMLKLRSSILKLVTDSVGNKPYDARSVEDSVNNGA